MTAIDAVELTRSLIRLESVNPPGGESACAALVADLLGRGGFHIESHAFAPGRVNVVARRGSGKGAPICLTGHLDTVPIGGAKWTMDPFAADIVDGRLYGRGSSDMKSGIAAMVAAALGVADQLDDGPGLLLVLTAGEETGCEGAMHLAGLDGVLGEAGAIVVGEPTGNRPCAGHRGALWLVAACHGLAAHGAMPDLGVNAIFRSIGILSKLRDYGFNVMPHESLGSPTLNVGRIVGGQNVNSVPDLAEISIDIRTTPSMAHPSLVEDLRRHLAPELDHLETLLDLKGVWTSPADPWVEQVGRHFSVDAATSPMGSVPFFTDASILKPAFGGAPTIILGPGETSLAHQTDEYCLVERIPDAVAIYTRLILDWQRNALSITQG